MLSPHHIGLVQINETHFGRDFLPYSAGLLQVYAQTYLQQPERFVFLPPIHQRLPVEAAVKQLEEADIVGFSTYIWNMQRSLAIAQLLKIQRPERLIIFGGPQVPDRAESFLQTHPFVDICCHGQGETVFLDILEHWPGRDWSGIAGISYLDEWGHFHTAPQAPRLPDLNVIPSPYLAGVFEGFMPSFPDTKWIALWETNRGCPFSCTFCDWGSATQSKVFTFDLERLFQELEWCGQHKIETLVGCDANFGILPRDIEIAQYIADVKRRTGYPYVFSMNATKNATERSYVVQKILSDAQMGHQVALSFQSLSPATLTSIRRDNISLDSYRELQQRFIRDKVDVYTDLILGLPGETYESFVSGVETAIASGQHFQIRFYDALILPNAEMADPDYRKKHGLQTVCRVQHNNQPNWGEGIDEQQEFVIATATMPFADMVRAKCFVLWTQLLYYENKPLQIPLLLLYHQTALQHRQVIEPLISGAITYPLLAQIQYIFQTKVERMHRGDSDKFTVADSDGKPSHLRGDSYITYWLLHEETAIPRLETFYKEFQSLLQEILTKQGISYDPKLLQESIQINKAIFQMAQQEKNPNTLFYFSLHPIEVKLGYNICEYYQAILSGEPIALQPENAQYRKHWDGPPYGLRKVVIEASHVAP